MLKYEPPSKKRGDLKGCVCIVCVCVCVCVYVCERERRYCYSQGRTLVGGEKERRYSYSEGRTLAGGCSIVLGTLLDYINAAS